MIHSVVDFRGSKVRDVMLPSAKVVVLHSGASTQEALELSTSTGLDRLPVLAPDGQPAGLVNVLGHPARTKRKQTAGRICAAHCNNYG